MQELKKHKVERQRDKKEKLATMDPEEIKDKVRLLLRIRVLYRSGAMQLEPNNRADGVWMVVVAVVLAENIGATSANESDRWSHAETQARGRVTLCSSAE